MTIVTPVDNQFWIHFDFRIGLVERKVLFCQIANVFENITATERRMISISRFEVANKDYRKSIVRCLERTMQTCTTTS